MKNIIFFILMGILLPACGSTEKTWSSTVSSNDVSAFAITPSAGSEPGANGQCVKQKTFFFSVDASSQVREACSGSDPNAQPFAVLSASIDDVLSQQIIKFLKKINFQQLNTLYVSSPSSSDTDGPAYYFVFYRDLNPVVRVKIDVKTTASLPAGLVDLFVLLQSGQLGI